MTAIVALLEIGWTERQQIVRRPSVDLSPSMKLRPAPLALRTVETCDPAVRNSIGHPQKLQAHSEQTDSNTIEASTTNTSASSNSPSATDSWPPTPAFPDRLPSASLMDRVAFSPTDSMPGRCFPNYVSGGTARGRQMLAERTCLIERSDDCRVRALADCSEPSPIAMTHAAAKVYPEELFGYPHNLYMIYKPVYPHFDLYAGPLAIEVKTVSSRSVEKQTLSYPYNLYSLYPAVYPHLDLYPSQPKMRILSRQILPAGPCKQEWPAYPYSLNAIYPPCYPHFDLYPSRETCQLAPSPPQPFPMVAAVTPLPRRKMSASRLSPIYVERAALQAQMVDSPSEKIDLSRSKDVSEFRRKRSSSRSPH